MLEGGIEVVVMGGYDTTGVLGLGAVACLGEELRGTVVVAGLEGSHGCVKVGDGVGSIEAQGGGDGLVELCRAFGIEACHAEHLVEAEQLGSLLDDLSELLVAGRLEAGADGELGASQLGEPYGQDLVTVELGKAGIGLQRGLLGIEVGRAVGGTVDEGKQVCSLLRGDVVGCHDLLTELSPVLGHSAKGALLGGQVVSRTYIFR